MFDPRYVCAGSISIALQFRPEGPSTELTAGGFDKTVWKSEEWCEWHQDSQVVCYNRLDCYLPEEGEPFPSSIEKLF